MAAENQLSITLRFDNMFAFSLLQWSLYFDQQHKAISYFDIFTKNGGSIQDGGSKPDF
jgi:hypothetical protein